MGLKILVTGGSGHVGRYVVDELLACGHDVAVMDRNTPGRDVPFVRGDVTSFEDCRNAVEGYDVVVHLAAIPNPLSDPASHVMRVNVMGTYNIHLAAANAGVRRVISAGSDSALGFVFQRRGKLLPRYLPIDENHELRPQDPYGLSKKLNEEIARSFSDGYGLETVVLRLCFVWFPERKDDYLPLVRSPEKWARGLWVYNDVRDVAQAMLRACEISDVTHEVLFISAADNGTCYESASLINEFYPEVTEFKRPFTGYESLVNCTRAVDRLGYAPHHSWREWFTELA